MKLADGPVLTSGGLDDPFLPKLLQAINRASSIEISVSFIQRSGLDLIFDALSDALERQATIDIVTSDYLYITDPVALRHLMILQSRGANTKIFTCKSGQSFHMKTYIFIQQQKDQADTGCAYVGSNNISKAAFTHAFEWCLRHDLIENQERGKGGEIQITDALLKQAKAGCVLAYKFKGKRFDCGSIEGYIEATNFCYENLYKKDEQKVELDKHSTKKEA